MSDLTREALIDICERAIVPHDRWSDRDTPGAQEGVGKAWAFLKAGCEFRVMTKGKYCVTGERTIWIEIDHDDFGVIDWGGPGETETFYLPTHSRLEQANGSDWY